MSINDALILATLSVLIGYLVRNTLGTTLAVFIIGILLGQTVELTEKVIFDDHYVEYNLNHKPMRVSINYYKWFKDLGSTIIILED